MSKEHLPKYLVEVRFCREVEAEELVQARILLIWYFLSSAYTLVFSQASIGSDWFVQSHQELIAGYWPKSLIKHVLI